MANVRIKVAIDAAVMVAVGSLMRWGLDWRIAGGIALALGSLLLAGALASPAFAAAAIRWKARLVAASGVGLTWLLLAPLFLVGFSFGRLLLRLTGRDPLNRAFPCRDATCWIQRPPSRGPAGYRNLY